MRTSVAVLKLTKKRMNTIFADAPSFSDAPKNFPLLYSFFPDIKIQPMRNKQSLCSTEAHTMMAI